MPSSRNFKKRAWLCANYEAQDVLAETGDVDLLCLEPGHGYEFRELWQRRLMYRDFSGTLAFANPGLRKVKLTRDYDLFLVRCQTFKDLLDVNALEGLKDHCKTSVCWLDELWAASIPNEECWLRALNQFDHVFIGFSGTVASLAKAIGQPCNYLPGGVDSLRFNPYPDPPSRVVDVYSIGRREEGIHKALIEEARRRDMFYVYDTFAGSQVEPYDHRQHREHYANVAKRSKYFMVAPGKFDCLDETQGQEEIGHRYFEGAAAGTVMIGQAPNCAAFRALFSWPDAVIEVRSDGSDAIEILDGLTGDPDRISDIARRNAVQALLHHDWVFRWKEILRIAGMEPSLGMTAREQQLKELAHLVDGTVADQAVAERQ